MPRTGSHRRPPTARLEPGARPSRPILLSTGRGTKRLSTAEAVTLADELRAAAEAWAAVEERRRQADPPPVCPWCGQVFGRRRKGQVWCSEACRRAHGRHRADGGT